MSDEVGAKVVHKKVRAYPFAAHLQSNGVKKTVDVAFLSLKGLIAVLPQQIVHVGEYYELEFELPTTNRFVLTKVRVLKTYDKVIDPKVRKVERMAEFHFEKLTADHKTNILDFLRVIGQK